jgi:hypothetical protein
VAIESTGVYWIPLYQILERAGLEVVLVNARHCKNLPGRKTDVQEFQWLQHLHSIMRPPPFWQGGGLRKLAGALKRRC